jgi:hypothetical protein
MNSLTIIVKRWQMLCIHRAFCAHQVSSACDMPPAHMMSVFSEVRAGHCATRSLEPERERDPPAAQAWRTACSTRAERGIAQTTASTARRRRSEYSTSAIPARGYEERSIDALRQHNSSNVELPLR